MLQQDIDALTARFTDTSLSYSVKTQAGTSTVVLPDSQRLVVNQPAQQVDETKPWVRFSIEPGKVIQALSGLDRTYEQHGFAYLQVFAPPGTGTRQAGSIRDQFLASFRSWRSADNRLNVEEITFTAADNKDAYAITIKARWHSTRVAS